MWSKCREFGVGNKDCYENSHYASDLSRKSESEKAKSVVDNWIGSSGHRAVMRGDGDWAFLKKIGCYAVGNYANCWFSE